MQINHIKSLIATDLDAVHAVISDSLMTDVSLIKTICEHIIYSGGKQLRPIIVLLVSNAIGTTHIHHHKLATIIEFLHTATLLHDDVIDESNKRRGEDSANRIWGNRPSILVGDFLLSKTLQIMVNIGRLDIVSLLANTTNTITTGEMLQLTNRRQINASEHDYLAIISAKTSELFAAAAKASAMLSNASLKVIESMYAFGIALGNAFQLIDDALDYIGDENTLGKQVGDDLAEGKPTLPLIYALQHGDTDTKELIQQALTKGHGEHLTTICEKILAIGGIDYTYKKAHDFAQQARQHLQSLPDNAYRQALDALVTFAVLRQN